MTILPNAAQVGRTDPPLPGRARLAIRIGHGDEGPIERLAPRRLGQGFGGVKGDGPAIDGRLRTTPGARHLPELPASDVGEPTRDLDVLRKERLSSSIDRLTHQLLHVGASTRPGG